MNTPISVVSAGLGTLEAQILVLSQEYDDNRRSVADVFLKVAQRLYQLPLNAQCLMLLCQSA